MDFSELREYTHGCFSNFAELLGDGFVQVHLCCLPLFLFTEYRYQKLPVIMSVMIKCLCFQYLPHVVPLVFASCNLDDGSAVDIDESDNEENANGFGGVSSDDDAHDEPRVRNISVRTGVLDEKAAATQAIGQFALHTKSSYAQ